jgi:hypothetical protein
MLPAAHVDAFVIGVGGSARTSLFGATPAGGTAPLAGLTLGPPPATPQGDATGEKPGLRHGLLAVKS